MLDLLGLEYLNDYVFCVYVREKEQEIFQNYVCDTLWVIASNRRYAEESVPYTELKANSLKKPKDKRTGDQIKKDFLKNIKEFMKNG